MPFGDRKIAIVYERELDVGGVEAHLLTLFQRMPQAYHFDVFAPVSDRFRSEASAWQVGFHPLRRFTAPYLREVYHLWRTFKQEKIDLVHIHSPVAAIPGRLAAKLCGLTVVVTAHLTAFHYYGERQSLRSRLGRWLYVNLDRMGNYCLTDCLIFVSQHSYDEAVRRRLAPAAKSVVIPNGIDLSKFQKSSRPDRTPQDLRRDFGVSQDDLVLTFSGRLDPQKGVDILIRALAAMTPESRRLLKVWLIGSGPQEAELRAMCQAANLQDMITFHGYQEHVVDFLLASDIFVLPSRYEAMPISLLEALAAGLPCIVTEVGDNSRLVEDRVQGLVVPPDDPASLARAIQEMTGDKDFRLRVGKNARIKSMRYDQRQMTQQIELIYNQLAA